MDRSTSRNTRKRRDNRHHEKQSRGNENRLSFSPERSRDYSRDRERRSSDRHRPEKRHHSSRHHHSDHKHRRNGGSSNHHHHTHHSSNHHHSHHRHDRHGSQDSTIRRNKSYKSSGYRSKDSDSLSKRKRRSRSKSRTRERGKHTHHHDHHYHHSHTRKKRGHSSYDDDDYEDESSRERKHSSRRHHRRHHSKRSRHSKKHKRHHKHHKHRDYSKGSSYHEKKKKKHKNASKVSSDDGKDRSKDAGHYRFKIGQMIKDRYKINKFLGDGTFGRVVEVEDTKDGKLYAMKIIRAVERYVESAMTEMDIIKDLNQKDPQDDHYIVRHIDSFHKYPDTPKKEQNYFMVFERLGMSLYEYLKRNRYQGFSVQLIQAFAKQMLIAVGFMHKCGLTHTDLKPENILLVNDESDIIKIKTVKSASEEHDDRSSTRSTSVEKIFYRPKFNKIKLIDMGGATYDDDYHSSIINTRQYRAPEVMLQCCKWDHLSDVWSLGCILLELYGGNLFFETHETYEHLAMIDKARGPIPYWMASRAEQKMKKYFVLEGEFYDKHKTFLNWPKNASGADSIRRVAKMKQINDIIPSKYPEFRDFVKKMLDVDPRKRATCEEALKHPFFQVDYDAQLKQEQAEKQAFQNQK